jgi:hypothetical protein
MLATPNYKLVKIDKNGGEESLKVWCPDYPQSISGDTEEYVVLSNLPVNAYPFSTANPETVLGKPNKVDQHYYMVNGAVLNQNDDPPTQYQVHIEIWQDGKQIDLVLDPEDGPGQISDTGMPFLHKFQLVSA